MNQIQKQNLRGNAFANNPMTYVLLVWGLMFGALGLCFLWVE